MGPAERALREAEERLRFALDAVDAGTWDWELKTGALVFSMRARSLLGLPLEGGATSYDEWLQAILPEDRPQTDKLVTRALKEAHELRVEYRVRTATGSIRWLMGRGRPLRGDAEELIGFSGVLLDVTDRMRVERAEGTSEREALLRDSEVKFRTLVEQAADIVVVVDEGMKVRFWSPGAVAAFGWTESETIGKTLSFMRHPDDAAAVRRAYEAVTAAPGATAGAAVRYRHKGGEWRVVEWTARNLLHDLAVRGIVLNVRDVTERVRSEQELQRTQRLEALGVLAGGIAHDFNNLLTAVFSHVELALVESAPDSSVRRDLAIAAAALDQGRALTRQLLTFARGGAPVRTLCDVEKLVRGAIALSLGASSNVRCEVRIAPGVGAVDVDSAQLSQVLGNVLINARQAMPEGGVITVSVANQPDAPFVEIRVADRGVGIPAEVLPKVFDPFFTTKPNGTGLGLATAHSILRRHGGAITVDSAPGGGTTVTLRLPTASPSVRGSAPPPGVAAPRASCRVLLMDDHPELRRAGSRLLSRLGCDVETAADGEEAVRLYGQALGGGARFDVVVLDLTVPGGMGGAAAVVRLKELDPEVKAIVCSGYSEDPVIAEPMKYGFVAALAKPYQAGELGRAIQSIVGPVSSRRPASG